MDSISKEGFYVGPEVQWNIDDVEAIAISDFELDLSQEDLKRVLISSFQDNDWLMERMHDCIKDTIHYMLQEGQLTKPEEESESNIKSDVEEMARFLDYIGLDVRNCTMQPDFCEEALKFANKFVEKYQTHRAI